MREYLTQEKMNALLDCTSEKEVSEIKNSVNHPQHYNREGALECLEEMRLIFGDEVVAHFCLCNTWKYRYRAADKNGVEDLKKSDWYMKKYRDLSSKTVHSKTELGYNPYQE